MNAITSAEGDALTVKSGKTGDDKSVKNMPKLDERQVHERVEDILLSELIAGDAGDKTEHFYN